MANKIIHKHSSVVTEGVPKLPDISQLEYGEIAVNYAEGVETITLKNTADEIIEFKSKDYFEGIIIENEKVTAASLTDINNKLSTINIMQEDLDDRIDAVNTFIGDTSGETLNYKLNQLNSKIEKNTELIQQGSEPVYDTNMDENLTMDTSVGGISSGTTVADLKGRTIDSILDDLLFPTLEPTHTNPSVSGFTLNPTSSVVAINSNVSTISEAILNRGVWNEYNTIKTDDGDIIKLPYAGTATTTTYEIKINNITYTDRTSLPEKFTVVGNQTYKVTINYGEGETPKNNKGIELTGLTAPASAVTSSKSVNVTYPWYASTVSAGTLTQQSLISWNATAGKMTSGQIKLVAQAANADADKKQSFATPRTITKVETLNTLSNQWVTTTSSWNQYGTETLNGITYYKYNFNTDASNDAQIIKVTF